MATSLADMVLRARQESDQVNSDFLSPAEWVTNVTQSYAELYGLVATVYGADYFVQTPSTGYLFTTDGVNQFFALPTDFFKLLGVDVLYGSANQWIQLKPFAFAQRNMYSGTNQAIPAAGQTVRLFYVPTPPVFDVGNDLLPVLVANGWDEYIAIDAAMKAMAKEESDVSVLAGRKAVFTKRLEDEATNRDAGNPAKVVDSRGRGSPSMSYRINGTNLWLQGQRVDAYPATMWGGDVGWGAGW